MISRHVLVTTFAALAVTLLGVGCGAQSEDVSSSESMARPADPSTPYLLAQSCGRLYKRHESVRAVDIRQGVIRWSCADVPGVTDPDLGQEYCEYQAVQNGKSVRTAADLTSGPVSCVFTSVFKGAGEAPSLRAAMADDENLGFAVESDSVVQMQNRFNTRSAATKLVAECSRSALSDDLPRRLRYAACVQAVSTGSGYATEIEARCKADVMDSANWSELERLGVKIAVVGDGKFEEQRDIAGCMAVKGSGVVWRNSDPMVCGRVSRAASECSCKFNSVPRALKGVPFTGWVDDQLPAGCRLAKVNGADYPFVTICPVTKEEVSDIPLNPRYRSSIANYCHDRFAVNLVMKLPLRVLQKQGTCTGGAGYCQDYMRRAPSDPSTDGEPIGDDTSRRSD